MAEKRMFSQKITRSDAFLAMPTSARLLYYDLSMDADDDGFVDRPKSIMRLTGASDDDLAVLIAKSFVIPFDNGICVIKHWRINNYIRGDRYKETNYLELKNKLSVKDNGSYTLKCNSGIPSDNQVTTKWEHRLDKNRLDKSSIYIKVKSDDLNQPIALQNSDVNPSFEEQKCTPTKSKTEKDFEMIWSIYPRKLGKKDAFKYFQQSLKQGTSVEEIKIGVEKYAEYISRNKIEPQFIKHGKTWFYQKCWQDDYSENFATGKSPFTKRVKETPEWLQNYEEKEEKIAEEISEEEAKKILDELKGKQKKMNKALKLKQTKANKQKFWSPLLDLLKITTPVTRGELQNAVGFSDRAVRKEISNISKFHPVISYSSKKGYRLAQDFSKLNVEEAAAEWLEVEHSLNELKARNRDINKRMKPLIAYQKKMEKVRPEVLFEIEKRE